MSGWMEGMMICSDVDDEVGSLQLPIFGAPIRDQEPAHGHLWIASRVMGHKSTGLCIGHEPVR